MHRIAYLLYRHRQETTANDVIIFSPSNVQRTSPMCSRNWEENVLKPLSRPSQARWAEHISVGLMDFQEQLATASAQEAADLAALAQKSSRSSSSAWSRQ